MKRSNWIILLAAVLVAIIPSMSWAELPPSAYEDMQKRAAFELEIFVYDVETKIPSSTDPAQAESTPMQVEAKAKVLKVVRGSAVKVGDSIEIEYDHKPLAGGMVGPSPIPILKVGMTCPAWLNPDDDDKDDFVPAAGGYSFQGLKTP